MADKQYVMLQGGSFDGQVAEAGPPAEALRLAARLGDEKWTELYLYKGPETVDHPEHGQIRVMLFMRRDEIQ